MSRNNLSKDVMSLNSKRNDDAQEKRGAVTVGWEMVYIPLIPKCAMDGAPVSLWLLCPSVE